MLSVARKYSSAFTIVELIVVVMVIGIISTVSVIAYGGWQRSIAATQLKSDLSAAASAMESHKNFNNTYPSDVLSVFTPSDGVAIGGGSPDGFSYCVDAVSIRSSDIVYYMESPATENSPQEGTCATRPEPPGQPVPPSIPLNLVASTTSSSSIGLTWVASSDATGYRVEASTSSTFVGSSVVASPSTNSATVGGLAASTQYFFRVKSVNHTGESGWSNGANATTSAPSCSDTDQYGSYPDCYAYDSLPIASSIHGYWSSAPDGYLLEDGSAVSRTTYAELFAAIGTTYGAGDGSTTFNLPDSRGRVAVNRSASDAEFDTMGEKSGAKTHTLTIAQIPSHSHSQNVTANSGGPAIRNDYSSDVRGSAYAQGVNTGSAGGGGAHNNIQPSIVQQFAIKYRPSTGAASDLTAGSSVDGYWTSAPSGYLIEDGSAVSRTTYADLFAAIGTTYGAGNGSTTFNLPDSRGRVSVNRNAADTEFDVMGEKSGAKTHTLSISEIPSHSHLQYTTANSGSSVRIDHKSDASGHIYSQGVNTGAAGGGGAHNNIQPSIVKTSVIKYTPQATPPRSVSIATSVFGYWSAVPEGYLLEDGSAVSRTQFPSLFAIIGTTYGAGDGWSTFNLPDSRGRIAVNKSDDSEFATIGQKYGTKRETLTLAQIPSHSHAQYVTANSGSSDRSDYSRDGAGGVYSQGINTGAAGGGGSHNNIQPSIVGMFVIKY